MSFGFLGRLRELALGLLGCLCRFEPWLSFVGWMSTLWLRLRWVVLVDRMLVRFFVFSWVWFLRFLDAFFSFEAEGCFWAPAKMSRKGLMEQDLNKLDVTKLHPLSPEVISRQATINIGSYLCLYFYASC